MRKVGTCLWILLTLAGFWRLLIYSNTPGSLGASSSQWPKKSKLTRGTNQPTLIVFLHPQCPCSAATVGELERLAPFLKEKVSIYALFLKPPNFSEAWVKTNLWDRVNLIPGVSARIDPGGEEAKSFGAETSGMVAFYDSGGSLAFRGGITPARGHMGDNLGRATLLSLVAGEKPGLAETKVFGCALHGALASESK